MKEPVVGSVVFSNAGRTRGYFVVVRIEENCCYIADGKMRTADDPKKKKIKHLTVTEDVARDVKEKIESGKKVGRETLRKALRPYDNNGRNSLCQKTTSLKPKA